MTLDFRPPEQRQSKSPLCTATQSVVSVTAAPGVPQSAEKETTRGGQLEGKGPADAGATTHPQSLSSRTIVRLTAAGTDETPASPGDLEAEGGARLTPSP